MPKRNRETSQRAIEKRIAIGRGEGRLSEYKPWLHIQDVPSRGLVTRIKGWKTGRVHHLLSILELTYFYILEWSQDVIDIREQFPLLPLEETVAIAQACGIRHPSDPRTKHPVVMTTDFVITVHCDSREMNHARTLKHREDLSSRRTLEKLEIERQYWKVRKIDWKIVTEADVPAVLSKNVEWIHQYFRLEDFSALSAFTVRQIIFALAQSVSSQNVPLRDVTLQTDERLGLEPGTSLSMVRHLLASRHWQTDMNKAINPGERLYLLTEPSSNY